jgi:hypothetical protein
MELALMAGKWLFVALIYLFVFMVYRGLLRQGATAGAERARRDAPPAAYRREPSAPAVVAPRPQPPSQPSPPPVTPPVAVAAPEPAPAERSAALLDALHEAPPAAAAVVPAPPAPVAARPATLPLAGTNLEPDAPRLTVIHSQTPEIPVGREFTLLAAATIGRADFNAVPLPDHFASMQHAIIFLQDGRRVLRDRDSTNGTMLNGRKVIADMVLRDGDQITIGTTVLKYSQPAPDQP